MTKPTIQEFREYFLSLQGKTLESIDGLWQNGPDAAALADVLDEFNTAENVAALVDGALEAGADPGLSVLMTGFQSGRHFESLRQQKELRKNVQAALRKLLEQADE